MTSEEWIALIPNEKDRKYARAAVEEAIEKERAGEVVLCCGRVDFVGWTECNGPNSGGKQVGKRGSLIFRPDTKEKI